MSRENVLKLLSPRFKDNKSVDLFAAIITGIALCYLDLRQFPTFLVPLTYDVILQSALIRIGAFALIAVILFLWRHPLRAKFGWVAIAVLGLIIIAGIDDKIQQATTDDPDFMLEFSAFPMEIILFIVPSLLVMGATHFVGVQLLSRKRKEREKSGNAI